MTMACVRIDGRDDPGLRDLPGDPDYPALTLVEILTHDRRQQRGRLR